MDWGAIARRYPLLTPAQELQLGRLVREWQDWPGGPDAAPAAVRRRGLRAREKFVLCNLRLLMSNIRPYLNRMVDSGLEIDDLYQEAVVGLTRAVELFDPKSGYKFSTYSTWWIRQAFGRVLSGRQLLVRVPTPVHSALVRLKQGHLSPDDLELSLRKRAEAAAVMQKLHSLDAVVATAEGATSPLAEVVAAPEGPSVLEEADLRAALCQLRRHDADALALLELVAEGWHAKWMAQLLGCRREELDGRIEAARAELRQAVPGVEELLA